MSTLTPYTPIPDGTGATPSVFNSRYSLLHQNLDILNIDKLEIVTTGDIADGAVGNDQLATNAVSSGKIQAQAVTGDKIATSSKITCTKVIPTDGYPDGVKFTEPGSADYVQLENDSNGGLRIIQKIGSNNFNYTWVNSHNRMLILGDYPTSSISAAATGEFSASSQYFYHAVSTNSWKRAALTGW